LLINYENASDGHVPSACTRPLLDVALQISEKRKPHMHAPNLSDARIQAVLPLRNEPHWNILSYCRHIGLRKRTTSRHTWHARYRDQKGRYKQTTLGDADKGDGIGLSYTEALERAYAWFSQPRNAKVASKSRPVGVTQSLHFQPTTDGKCIGDALADFVEWKRIAATRATFEVLVSLINHHIIPLLGTVKIDTLTGGAITEFCKTILESSPKRGNQEQAARVTIAELSADALRKRKSTVNTLLGILRVALRMAWENRRTESERPWRCIRRLPNHEVPRQIFLTREQCRKLIGVCRHDLAQLVRAALYSGCRVTELAELTAGDVGRDIFGLRVSPGKNHRFRHVFLPNEGMSFFFNCARGKAPGDVLFRTVRGDLWRGNHRHLFKAAVLDAGLPSEFVFHGLRHTYASQLVQAGAPLAIVARQLGHANTDTVSRTYGHLSCESIERELALRFAPIDPTYDNQHFSSDLRASLQGKEPKADQRSWPRSNSYASSDTLLNELKDG
jgi:integrase/recombinase XerD